MILDHLRGRSSSVNSLKTEVNSRIHMIRVVATKCRTYGAVSQLGDKLAEGKIPPTVFSERVGVSSVVHLFIENVARKITPASGAKFSMNQYLR